MLNLLYGDKCLALVLVGIWHKYIKVFLIYSIFISMAVRVHVHVCFANLSKIFLSMRLFNLQSNIPNYKHEIRKFTVFKLDLSFIDNKKWAYKIRWTISDPCWSQTEKQQNGWNSEAIKRFIYISHITCCYPT